MNLKQAEGAFRTLLASVSSELIPEFLLRVRDVAGEALNEVSNADAFLQGIQEEIRNLLPVNALLPSEQFQSPSGQNGDGATTVHVDGFLYDEDAVDELCDQGKMSRNFCTLCGSQQVAPLTFISHSMTSKQLKFIMQCILPGDLRGKTLIDIGSRTGAVLYAAYAYSEVSSIVGVELNADFCQLQLNIVEKYSMQDRVKIIHSDVCAQESLLLQADIIVMNNVFEYFLDLDTQKNIWNFLRRTLSRQGSLLVTCPSLTESLLPLGLVNIMSGWVEEMDTQQARGKAYKRLFDDPDSDELDSIHLYRIL